MNIDYYLLTKYDEILDGVHAAGADASLIAGGAIRDMITKKNIKDIDVHYISTNDLNPEILKQYFTVQSIEEHQSITAYPHSKFSLTHPKLIMENCEYPIQLIRIQKDKRKTRDPYLTLQEHVDKFGCNLSKMIYNGSLVILQEAVQDLVLHQLTFTDDLLNAEYMYRIKEKYPEYTVVNESNFVYNKNGNKNIKLSDYAPQFLNDMTAFGSLFTTNT